MERAAAELELNLIVTFLEQEQGLTNDLVEIMGASCAAGKRAN